MVDRLEELLARMVEENDEEQEDALALEADRAPPAASAPKREGGLGSSEDLENREGPKQAESKAPAAPMENGELWAAIPHTGGEYPPEDEPQGDAAIAAARQREAAETPEKAVAETVRALGKNWLETPRMRRSAEQSEKTVQEVGSGAQSGLEELYRRTTQASRPAVQNLPVEQAGRTLHAEEPGRAAALTVEELDRAVRRDSRRYDGGMTIF